MDTNKTPAFTGRPQPPRKQEYSKPRLNRSVEPDKILTEKTAMVGTPVKSLLTGKTGSITAKRKQHRDDGPPVCNISIVWADGKESNGNLIPPDGGDFVMLRIV